MSELKPGDSVIFYCWSQGMNSYSRARQIPATVTKIGKHRITIEVDGRKKTVLAENLKLAKKVDEL